MTHPVTVMPAYDFFRGEHVSLTLYSPPCPRLTRFWAEKTFASRLAWAESKPTQAGRIHAFVAWDPRALMPYQMRFFE